MKPVAPVRAMSRLCGEAGLVTAVPPFLLHALARLSPLKGICVARVLDLARHLGGFSSVSRRILPSSSSVKA